MTYYIGIDIGGTTIKGGLLKDGKIIKYYEKNTEAEKGKGVVISNIKRIYHELIADRKRVGNISCLGVSFPGIIRKDGKVIDAPHIPAIRDVNLKKIFSVKNIVFENDVRCFAYGEMKRGAGIGLNNFIAIAIGTGVGSGIIINKKIYRGTGGSGEIGHNAWLEGIVEKKMIPGISGDFDSILGWRSIVEEYNKRGGEKINPHVKDIFSSKELCADKITEEVCYNTGLMISQAINVLAPEAVILGGSVGLYVPIKRLKKYIRIFTYKPNYKRCKILKSKLEEYGGIIGSGELSLELLKQKIK